MSISFTSNKFFLSSTDSCAHLKNANRIMEQYSTKNRKQKRTVTETTNNKFTFIRIKQGDKKENCDANKINCRPQHW